MTTLSVPASLDEVVRDHLDIVRSIQADEQLSTVDAERLDKAARSVCAFGTQRANTQTAKRGKAYDLYHQVMQSHKLAPYPIDGRRIVLFTAGLLEPDALGLDTQQYAHSSAVDRRRRLMLIAVASNAVGEDEDCPWLALARKMTAAKRQAQTAASKARPPRGEPSGDAGEDSMCVDEEPAPAAPHGNEGARTQDLDKDDSMEESHFLDDDFILLPPPKRVDYDGQFVRPQTLHDLVCRQDDVLRYLCAQSSLRTSRLCFGLTCSAFDRTAETTRAAQMAASVGAKGKPLVAGSALQLLRELDAYQADLTNLGVSAFPLGTLKVAFYLARLSDPRIGLPSSRLGETTFSRLLQLFDRLAKATTAELDPRDPLIASVQHACSTRPRPTPKRPSEPLMPQSQAFERPRDVLDDFLASWIDDADAEPLAHLKTPRDVLAEVRSLRF